MQHTCNTRAILSGVKKRKLTVVIFAGAETDASCLPCPGGYYCKTPGISSSTDTKCAAGYYCGKSKLLLFNICFLISFTNCYIFSLNVC